MHHPFRQFWTAAKDSGKITREFSFTLAVNFPTGIQSDHPLVSGESSMVAELVMDDIYREWLSVTDRQYGAIMESV